MARRRSAWSAITTRPSMTRPSAGFSPPIIIWRRAEPISISGAARSNPETAWANRALLLTLAASFTSNAMGDMRGLFGIDVVVLAGGLGTRIRGVLGDTPKVLAPINGRPFLDHLLDHLARLGAGRAVLSLGVGADRVSDHLAHRPPPLPVIQVIEPAPLGTAGALRHALPCLSGDPVMVMNGDTWLETDFAAFLAEHHRAGRPVSLLC
ncbi:MAG: hypothetical protein EPN20_08070, partial [Magnetospirillum sp.]